MSRVDLDTVKKRLEERQKPDAPVPAPEPAPVVRSETLAQIQAYEQDVVRLRKEAEEDGQKVDLGPVPEGVTLKDLTYYRGTSFDNKKVRAAIEARCREMDFADLVLTGRVVQVVPVIPDKLTFEFQSLTGADSFWIENNAQAEAQTEWGLKSWVLWAQLTMSLVGLNGKPFPSHLGKDGEVDGKLFRDKQTKIMKLGAKVLDIAVTNMNWFNERVDRILENDFEQLGNG